MENLADLYLIKTEYSRDDIGQQVETETLYGPVPCTVNDITRQEWLAAAGQDGLQPSCMCFLADAADYEDESTVVLNDVRYSVYRSYHTTTGGVELYLQREAGS